MTPGNQSLRPAAGRTSGAKRVNPGRSAACERLSAEARGYPEFTLEPLATGTMPERDAALAHAIYDGAIRRWLTIRALASRFLRQPWPALHPQVQAGLLAGGAQLLFFDRVPAHSAIDEAVEWVKGGEASRGSGLVNAVLRRIAEQIARDEKGETVRRDRWENRRDEVPLADGSALVLRSPLLHESETRRAAEACGLPDWQVRAWADAYGFDDALHMGWHAVATAPTVLNVAFAAEDLDGTLVGPHEREGSRVFLGSREDLVRLLARREDVWVQDSTSAAALDVVDEDPTGPVVDLCAGRGTKTRQLAAAFPGVELVACDVAEARLRDLEQLAAKTPALRVEHASRVLESHRARAALVVADVPCSNSGVLARRVEARHRCSAEQVRRLNEHQRAILRDAAALLAPGGRLVYSTCSLEPRENEEMAAWAEGHLGLRLVLSRQTIPAGGPGRPTAEYRDGGFSAMLRRER